MMVGDTFNRVGSRKTMGTCSRNRPTSNNPYQSLAGHIRSDVKVL